MMGKKKIENGEILIHSFITVIKFDYCNSLFYGLPEYLVCRLQSIQNAAAHLILPRRGHYTMPIVIKALLQVTCTSVFKVKNLGICF